MVGKLPEKGGISFPSSTDDRREDGGVCSSSPSCGRRERADFCCAATTGTSLHVWYLHPSTKIVFLGTPESEFLSRCSPKPPPLDVEEEKMLANYVPVFVMLPVRTEANSSGLLPSLGLLD
jgi:hypothetical protein